ncbi:hypothetical protein OG417_31385 [Actinoallomurus sp. NBC_01490]|uniref:hypothetical protein n=1 Tax=Actinoallomurus sp. NBC_01490 TaxID=2903557 RepID=UPI002E35C59C|nr:hypothetical protein [Actinoallomurus sp. NBC_01490]
MTNCDVHLLAEKLADDCTKAGLEAEVLAPTRVRVGAPGGHARLIDTVRCMPVPHGDEGLMWWWSWGEPIGPAAHIPDAVRVISRVLSPRAGIPEEVLDARGRVVSEVPHTARGPHAARTVAAEAGDVPPSHAGGTSDPATPYRAHPDVL